MKRKRITIKDVAAHAGVSHQTVSRVLNAKDGVSEDTRCRVQEAITELGYHPNLAARGLSKQRTYCIGLVVPYSPDYLFSDPHLLQFICGVDHIASQRGFNLLLSTSQDGHPTPTLKATPQENLSAYERLVRAVHVDGVIVVETIASHTGIELLDSHGYPWVTLGYGIGRRASQAVHADDRGGARQATMHLLSLGHRRIGVISGPVHGLVAIEERLAGCRQALEDHDLALDPKLLVHGDYTLRSGYQAAQLLMAVQPPPTAIFALNDRMALGAIRYLSAHGWRVPEDISVVGFDDIPFDDIPIAEVFDPSLTTVRQPALEMGHQAARLLFDLIEGHAPATEPIVLPTELVVRSSTGPPAS
jgi:DNA-binding LacI/PurR family transcriptional regulator